MPNLSGVVFSGSVRGIGIVVGSWMPDWAMSGWRLFAGDCTERGCVILLMGLLAMWMFQVVFLTAGFLFLWMAGEWDDRWTENKGPHGL